MIEEICVTCLTSPGKHELESGMYTKSLYTQEYFVRLFIELEILY